MMIDVGTIPLTNSISEFVLFMDLPQNKNCGGCAGEIEVYKPTLKETGVKNPSLIG